MLFRAVAAMLLVVVPVAGQAAVTPQLVTRFGGLSDDPDRDLYQVRRVVRLDNGRFVVATRKPLAVRVFAPDGRELGPLGRVGEGPGEFRTAVDLGGFVGDTVTLVSHGTRRWIRYRTSGALVGEAPMADGEGLPGGLTMHAAHYSRHLLFGSRGCPSAPVLEANVPRGPFTYAEALTDGSGRTWRRDVQDPAHWYVHAADGEPRHEVRFPHGVVIHQFVGDLVVGVHTDADDADHVVMYRVRLPTVQGNVPSPCPWQPTRRDGIFRNLAIHARNAMSAGQALASDLRHFPASAAEIPNTILVITDGAVLRVLRASEESWVFAVSHAETGAVCVGSLGPAGLPGWEWGEIGCSANGGRKQ